MMRRFDIYDADGQRIYIAMRRTAFGYDWPKPGHDDPRVGLAMMARAGSNGFITDEQIQRNGWVVKALGVRRRPAFGWCGACPYRSSQCDLCADSEDDPAAPVARPWCLPFGATEAPTAADLPQMRGMLAGAGPRTVGVRRMRAWVDYLEWLEVAS